MPEILKNIDFKFDENSVERLVMSDEEYFGPGMKDYVSNSALGLINPLQGGSPKKFLKGFSDESKNQSSLELGSAVHQLFLEKDTHFLAEIEKPGGKVGFIMDTVFKMTTRERNPIEFMDAIVLACKVHDYYSDSLTEARIQNLISKSEEYYNYLKNYSKPGTIALSAENKQKVLGCLDNLKAHREIVELIFPNTTIFDITTYNEDVFTVNCEFEVPAEDDLGLPITVKVPFKMKADNWSIDMDNKIVTLNDLKTTGKSVNDFGGSYVKSIELVDAFSIVDKIVFKEGSFQAFHYHRQMAMYSHILWKYCERVYGVSAKDGWKMNVNMVVVETNFPHSCKVYKVSRKWLEYGKAEFVELIKRVAYHKAHGFDRSLDYSNEIFVDL